MKCEMLDTPVYVSTPIGVLVVVDKVYWACFVLFMGYQTWVDLII